MSEGQDCNLEKGEIESERSPISSGGAKCELESTTLEGEEKGESMSDVRFKDEILMQTVSEIGTDEDLTSVSIDEQMQIAKSMGIGVEVHTKLKNLQLSLPKNWG